MYSVVFATEAWWCRSLATLAVDGGHGFCPPCGCEPGGLSQITSERVEAFLNFFLTLAWAWVFPFFHDFLLFFRNHSRLFYLFIIFFMIPVFFRHFHLFLLDFRNVLKRLVC